MNKDLILRATLAAALSGMLGAVGIWAAWTVGWSFGAMASLFFYDRLKNALWGTDIFFAEGNEEIIWRNGRSRKL